MSGFTIPSCMTWSNVRRFGKMIPYYMCDGSVVHQEALEKLIYGTKDAATGKYIAGTGRGFKNFGSTMKQSLLETEAAYKGVVAEHGGFFKYAGKTLRGLPGEIGSGWKAASQTAKAAGKSALLGGLKGAGGALVKRIPLVGTLLYAVTEIPNIYRATKDGGVVAGATETLKTGIRITGFTAGASIGAAIGSVVPGVGTLIGGLVGGLLGGFIGDKVAGKSYTELKEENQREVAEQIQGGQLDTGSTNPFAAGVDPQQLAYLQEMVARDPRFQSQGISA